MEPETSRRLFDSLESGVLWFDEALRIVDANRAAREVLGLDDHALGARIDDLGWVQTNEDGEPMAEAARPVVRALNAAGASVSFVEVETDRGHDSFLLDEPVMFATVSGFLSSAAEARRIVAP